MSLALLIAFQATAAPPVDVRKIDFDLSHYQARPASLFRCEPDPGGILICGRRLAESISPEEMARLATIYEQGPVDAETHLFGKVRGRAYTEEVGMPNGQVSKRAMIGIKLPF